MRNGFEGVEYQIGSISIASHQGGGAGDSKLTVFTTLATATVLTSQQCLPEGEPEGGRYPYASRAERLPPAGTLTDTKVH
ncbi:hypothetical protein EYF80_012780 [Liparis tanakae]|uniref:Uncharacterized protein n=1 Tax=Liparis tanakae TaxID=230148 RepID=A0A4Z2IHK3_9TELE|nr:hypothetical protein EYF80_012780 [Liparis tanakae]